MPSLVASKGGHYTTLLIFPQISYTNLMEIKEIIENNRVISHIYFFTDYNTKTVRTAEKFLDTILNQIHFDPKIGYCGFYSKRSLRRHLKFQIFGRTRKTPKGPFPPIPFTNNKILRVIKTVLKKSFSFLKSEFTWIFVFPTFNLFVKKKMKGITGGSFWKNTILLFVHPEAKRWQFPLSYTVAHEFNHSVELKYFPISFSSILLDALIFEGRANNFAACVLKCEPQLGAKVLNKFHCRKIFRELQRKNLLFSKSRRLYYSVFFEGKQFPLWAGYSIGYQIVKGFLRKHPNMKWKTIMKLSPKEILESSGF